MLSALRFKSKNNSADDCVISGVDFIYLFLFIYDPFDFSKVNLNLSYSRVNFLVFFLVVQLQHRPYSN